MFKPGDKVVCVDNSSAENQLVEGRTYTVKNTGGKGGIIMLEGGDTYWFSDRFKLAT